MKLYKYRSLKDSKSENRFKQILKTKTLYGSRFNKLNDPMEGYFRCLHSDAPSVLDMVLFREDVSICSLSKRNDIGIMWSHYADEHQGCCIEVEVNDNLWKCIEVDYKQKPHRITPDSKVSDILKIKSPQWSNEEEVRFICESTSVIPLKVKITNIFWGIRMQDEKQKYYNAIVSTCLPNIHPKKMSFESIDFGYDKDSLNYM